MRVKGLAQHQHLVSGKLVVAAVTFMALFLCLSQLGHQEPNLTAKQDHVGEDHGED